MGLLLVGGQARRLDELRVLRAAQLGDPDLLAGGLLWWVLFVGDAVGDGDRWVLDIHGSIAGSVVDLGGEIRFPRRADVSPLFSCRFCVRAMRMRKRAEIRES